MSGHPALDFTAFAALVESTFDRPAGSVARATRCDEVPGWDSLGHSILLSRLSRRHHLVLVEADAARADTAGALFDRLPNLVAGDAA